MQIDSSNLSFLSTHGSLAGKAVYIYIYPEKAFTYLLDTLNPLSWFFHENEAVKNLLAWLLSVPRVAVPTLAARNPVSYDNHISQVAASQTQTMFIYPVSRVNKSMLYHCHGYGAKCAPDMLLSPSH